MRGEQLTEETMLTPANVNQQVRFMDPIYRNTPEGKFKFLIDQEKHILTPQIVVSLSTLKLDSTNPGYKRPKVPLMTIQAPSSRVGPKAMKHSTYKKFNSTEDTTP